MAEEKYSPVEVSPTPIKESEFLEQSIEAKNDWLAKIGSCLREDDKKNYSNITEVLSPEDKEKLLAGVKPAMDALAIELGITLPNDLLDRVYILDHPTFYRFTHVETSGSDPQAVTLSNRYVLIDHQALKRTAERSRDDFNTLLRMSIIHELWHSVDYMANWAKGEKILIDSAPQKGGLWVGVPETFKQTDASVGMYRLNEGFTQFRTEETQKKIGEKTKYEPYPADVEIIRILINNIGIEPFVRAVSTKDGLKDLNTAIIKRYGTGAFKTILLNLYTDNRSQRSMGKPFYSRTLNFVDKAA